jgi:hypothetical protein
MKNKINIAELLKNCPQGMELDCTIWDSEAKVFLKGVLDEHFGYPIEVTVKYNNLEYSKTFTEYGEFNDLPYSKCVIFPKGKNTWEGFVPPCKFKDGDIITSLNTSIYIFTNCSSIVAGYFFAPCGLIADHKSENHHFKVGTMSISVDNMRLASENEKQKLFDAIKANGYKWNEETKTLNKLVEPIEDKGNISDGYHTFNELYEYRLLYNASMFNELAKQGLYDVHKSKKHSDGTIPFDDENWFIVQAELPTGQISNHYEMKDWDLFNVPEKEKANPYDGHTPQDVAKRLRNFLTPKSQYPKTYEECAKLLNTYCGSIGGYNWKLLSYFQQLLICRDAYWKIAGEQMGLGKPWEPDWENTSPGNLKWCMSYSGNYIEFDQYKHKHHILAFPTEEMRAVFYENFKELIEQCKELLL